MKSIAEADDLVQLGIPQISPRRQTVARRRNRLVFNANIVCIDVVDPDSSRDCEESRTDRDLL